MVEAVLTREAGRMRLHTLDLLRGLCALGVATYHFSLWSTAPWPPVVQGVLAMFGTYGVSVFFILSGYSLAHAYARNFESGLARDRVQRYFQRRLGRLGPLFVAVVLLSLAGKLLFGGNVPDLYVTMANLSLLFGVVNPAATPVVGGWSIGVEVVFYIVFPLMLLMRSSAGYVLAAAVFMSAWISHDLLRHASLEEGWLLYVHPANHAVFFVAGVYMRLFDHRVRAIGTACLCSVALGLLAAMAVSAAGASELQLVTGWRRLVLVAGSLAFVGVVARLPLEGSGARLGTLFGGLSYPLYLIHPIVFFAARGRVEMTLPGVFSLLAFTVVLAALADRCVDGPLQRRVKGWGW